MTSHRNWRTMQRALRSRAEVAGVLARGAWRRTSRAAAAPFRAIARRRWSIASNLLELGGLGLVVAAAWTVATALGLLVAGLALLLIGYTAEGRAPRNERQAQEERR